MFTLEEINEERIDFQKYTSYNIPVIQDIIIEDTNNFYAKIKKEGISNGKYFIHISNIIDKVPLEYQKSIIWHEFVHLYDTFNIELEGNPLYYALSTYSEAHAESIKFRYLLHISLTAIVGAERRKIIGENGKTTLDAISTDYFNKCITMSRIIDTHPTPECFNALINYFCYFCGYLFLLTKKNADKIIAEAIKKLSQNHISIFIELYQSIMDCNREKCAAIYDGLYTYYMNMALNK